MYRFFRFRYALIRYMVFWMIFLSLIKFSTLYYYNHIQRSSSSSIMTKVVFPEDNNNDTVESQTFIDSSSSLSTKKLSINRTSILLLRKYAEMKNNEQYFYNEHLYKSDTRYVLLVQVHTRFSYLNMFINTLKHVVNINSTLIVFSHDYIDTKINNLVKNITFAPVIQIFYPFSQQLYPDEFPGLDPHDCPRDLPKHKALLTRCNNGNFPDKYGHYRESNIVQIKHHWWWKLNYVFNFLRVLRNRTDHLVLLLEEDFYLSPDALVFLQKMESEKSKLCPDCIFYTLGNLEKSGKQFDHLGGKVSIAYWHARYNLGMTISYNFWLLLSKYAEEFCTIDDYNWDWSLVYLAQQRFNYPKVLLSSATRLIHLGSCGTHHKKTCGDSTSDVEKKWNETSQLYTNNLKYLFPTSLQVHLRYEGKRPFKQVNGGWGDLRDRQLCLSFAYKDESIQKIRSLMTTMS
ncbi:unnamed protein product [Didymodactylos carnosus]|uniref:Alpha-1,6-mannosyl-glycoprotein 2-beta-N-acetylglucosaminyltransferase n=1 Tax=Didymodactylos carnosus TaxID=1234261 RepID=A0A813SQC3_9BILA|nr:unnamed protein product [Didymodactylos carnosus]CAF1082130.1 unnamed protein product [Didymodactylos carnosus]CAF3588378.1 unnamed protein product [Didymodactylos carnosus]CAF3844969.1 unnamed protein product [Didymodactylos carnosus]